MKCNCKSKEAIITVLIIAGGIFGAIDWYLSHPILLNIFPSSHQMRFTSALSFIMVGLIYFSVYEIIHADHKNIDFALLILPAAALSIILFVTFYVAEKIFGIPVDAENIFIGKSASLVRMSAVTAFSFFIIALVGLAAMFKIKWIRIVILIGGVIVGLSGLLAILGYALNIKMLYFDIDILGISGAMSLASAIIFLITGIGFSLMGICFDFNNIESIFNIA
ncbi:MAG: hypothetical protein M1334_04870 [Patescibacteria group bacterium]|nr:hypothetical protein [Patescibacteria group bacterium]